jgi:predicted ATPase/class 3 adenylate cyclase
MQAATGVVAFLFSDIEKSSHLWEQYPERMREALARHDTLARAAVAEHRGRVVKMLGDGVHAAFADPLDAVNAAVALQLALGDAGATAGIALKVRCGLHVGVEEHRDGDFFGRAVNRAARIMAVAHGGQVLVSGAIAALVEGRLPDGVALRELGQVQMRGLASPEQVYQVTHAALRSDFPALRALQRTPHNLPQQVTSFIGRERELAEVAQLLARNRLVTLQGFGGIGKTRLSLQVAAEHLDEFPDGVWFVELAALSDPRLAAQAAASVLGVEEEAGSPVIEALVKFVADRRLLLILDNCEHLVQACAEVASRLLQAGPQVKILTSSREPLHVGGEIIFALPPLAIPDPYTAFKKQALEGYAAARLFIERAVAAQPAFQISDDNAMAVAGICRQLDGIPLALELAAVRVRALSVEQIATRLADRFRLLTGGDRTAQARQQTLRAMVDWSYELLNPPERALFRRLAVFAGSFTLEAAEAIGADGDFATHDVLALLANLVDKSLITMDSDGGRYRMLETVRQYAQERLAESGTADEARARHAAFYLAFAEKAQPELFGPQQGAWLARFDLERENLLAVHTWCDRGEQGAALGLRLVHAFKPYLGNRGLPGLGHRITMEALARPGAQARDAARSRALFAAGQMCYFMGRYDEARALLEEGLAIAREIGDEHRVADILQPLGMAMLAQGDRPAARATLEEALDLARKHGERRDVAAALNALAQFHRADAALDAAEPLYAQVVALAREIGDRESIAVGLLNLAMVYADRGDVARARAALVDVHAIADEIGSKPVGQSLLEVCAGLAAAERNWHATARFFGIAEAQNELTGLHRDPADEAFLMPHVTAARERLGAAAFAETEAAGRELAYGEAMAEAQHWLDRRS